MGKINFTAEHYNDLKCFIAKAVINNMYIPGPMGQNYNVYELLHNLSISSLRSLSAMLTKKKASLTIEDEWVENPNAEKIEVLDMELKMLSLIIGYRLKKEEEAANAIERERITKQINELTEATKSPVELIADLKNKLKELE